jgi:hypothetical protein
MRYCRIASLCFNCNCLGHLSYQFRTRISPPSYQNFKHNAIAISTPVLMPSSEMNHNVVMTNSTSLGRICSVGADCDSQNMVNQGEDELGQW